MPEKKRSIGGNFFWVLSGNITYSFAQWIILILIVRSEGLAAAGIYGLAAALAAPLFALCNLSSRDLLVTEGRSESLAIEYFKLRLITSTLGSIALGMIGFLYLEKPGIFSAILVFAAIKWVEALHDIFEAILQKTENLKVVARYQILSSLLGCGAVGIALLAGKGLIVALICLLAARGAVLALIIRHVHAQGIRVSELLGAPWNLYHLISIARGAFPLGVRRLLVSWNTNAPRYILEYYLGVAAVGIYTAVSYLMYIGVTLCESLSQASATSLANYWQQSRKQFIGLLTKLLYFGLFVGASGVIISALAGDIILHWIYGDELAQSGRLLTLFMTAAALMFLYGYMNVAMTVLRLNNIQGTLAVVALLTNIAVALMLIPSNGQYGAAFGTLVGAAALLLGSFLILANKLKSTPEPK